jgi:UDP-N-acetyl-D-glucosamine/UDP-N-acetyl-D-galactosamine dehydrogenase
MAEVKIGIVGLGYVGLPLAIAFTKKNIDVVGFDVNERKIKLIKEGTDPTKEGFDADLKNSPLKCSSNTEILADRNFYIIVVPTPIDKNNQPDLSPLKSACNTVGKWLKKGDTVVFESTVYPGVTEEYCGPILEELSGLKSGTDFKLGYSPERVNPGDAERTLTKIIKVVSGQDKESLEHIAYVYSLIVEAGIHRAPSIMVAEAAKVIENTQRDLNIALVNELALIFDRLNISTREVLEVAGTKWNFLPFKPGLVGGHCIGVDPYYLTTKAQELGYHPEIILSGRRINDNMGSFVAQKLVKLLLKNNGNTSKKKVGILGLTFKENVADIRNSRIPDIISELRDYHIEPLVYDPFADRDEAMHEYNIKLVNVEDLKELDGLVLSVPHTCCVEMVSKHLDEMLKPGGIIIDVKSSLKQSDVDSSFVYWSL